MAALDLQNHILLNEGAYFYETGACKITKKMIHDLFNDVLDGIKYKVLEKKEKQNEQIDGDQVVYSLLVFRYNTVSSLFDFDKDNFPKELVETKIGYLLVVEVRSHVVIMKKNASHLTSFLGRLSSVATNVISGVMVNSNTDFQQMKLLNMNVSGNAMRTKTYEANDLRISMPMFGANQNIVTAIRFANDDGISAVNVSTSRIAKFGEKKGLQELLKWSNEMVHNIENYAPSNTFLSHFATPQSWRSLNNTLIPTSLLLNVFELQNYIRDNLDDKSIYRMKGKDNYIPWTDYFWRICRYGSTCLDLSVSNALYMYKTIGVRKSSIGIKCFALKPINQLYYKDNNGIYKTLSSLINKLRCFTVGFTDYSYLYAEGKLYKNSEIKSDLDSILEVLEPIAEISSVTSEKGSGYDEHSSDFSDGSLFRVVEKVIFHDVDFLLCDDMGNEWADHIALKGKTLSFIHSKCNDEGLSASNFQDVIGQAIKNIGNMTPSANDLSNKIATLHGKWNNTGIAKCRKGNIDDYEKAYNQLMINPNKDREVCLAVNFLSKKKLSDAFDKLKRDEPFKQRNSVVQLAWLLNGFISTCKEADLNCRIFCKK